MSKMHKLSAVSLKSMRVRKDEDGAGLRFIRRKDGTASWILRFTVHGRRRDMGLGPYPDVSLKEARDRATDARQLVKRGIDPIGQREKDKREAVKNLHLLDDVALDCFEAKKAELKDDGASGRWFSPMKVHVLPKLGRVPVAELDQIAIRDVLAPIWHKKAETAVKAANSLNLTLKRAAALGLNVDLQAVEKAKALLGKQRHVATHIPAMPWQDVPAFYRLLGNSVTELALRLLILTGVRSACVRLATPNEFDLAARVWTIPAANLKGRKGATQDFRVPLSDEAVTVVLEALRQGGAVLFSGNQGKAMSELTMRRYMNSRDMTARPHGFRSSFKTWAADTEQPFEVVETSLSHAVGNKVERTYQRSDHLEKRTALMQRWADHLNSKSADNIVSLSGVSL